MIELCARYPNQLHTLGCNDLHTLDAVKSTAYSVETSKWLDGGCHNLCQVAFIVASPNFCSQRAIRRAKFPLCAGGTCCNRKWHQFFRGQVVVNGSMVRHRCGSRNLR